MFGYPNIKEMECLFAYLTTHRSHKPLVPFGSACFKKKNYPKEKHPLYSFLIINFTFFVCAMTS